MVASRHFEQADINTRFGQKPSQRVLLIAPSPPPYGGMAIQARLLEKLLLADGNSVVFFASNARLPRLLRPVERIWGLRTAIRTTVIWLKLWGEVRRAEVVHVLAASWVYFFAVVFPAVVYTRLHRKRVVLNYRGGDAREFFRVYGWLVKSIFGLADVVSTPSQFLADVIQSCFRVPVSIVPNILNSAVVRFRPRAAFQPKMLVTRHLEEIYDVDTALKAFRKIQQHTPSASLWVAGTGSQEGHLRSKVSAWNLKNVRFLGAVPHEDLAAIYDQCDIMLNASRVDNFPGALLEASGAGLVVVSTSAGGIPTMYQSGKNALLVDPGDWEGLARAVENVLRCPSLGQELVRAALDVAGRCDWREVRKMLYAAYGFPVDESMGNVVEIHSSSGVMD